MKKLIKSVALFVFIISLTGCATILKQKSVDVAVNTDPEGANVFINGNRVGRTPVTLNLSHKRPVVLVFRKDGYEEMSHRIDNHIVGGWMVASVLCDVIPAGIDLATQSAWSLNETKVMVKLDPIEMNLSDVTAKEKR